MQNASTGVCTFSDAAKLLQMLNFTSQDAKNNDTATGEQEGSSSVRRAPYHLNSTGCHIRYTEGKGRGVFGASFTQYPSLVVLTTSSISTAAEE